MERIVDVGHFDGERAARPATRFRPEAVDLGVLVGEHQLAVADRDLGMTDAAVIADQAADFDCAERLDVEGDGCRRISHRDVGGDGLSLLAQGRRPG